MVDLEERFRRFRQAPAPDLWPQVERRGPRPSRREIPWRRLGVAAVALAVAAAGLVIAIRAFVGEEAPRPAAAPQLGPRVTAEIPVGPFPNAIAAGFGAVWVTTPTEDQSAEVVKRIDPATNEVVAEIPLEGFGHLKITAGEGAVWVTTVTNAVGPKGETSDFRGVVYRIDPATNQVAAEIPFSGGFGRDIAAGEGGVWVAQETDNRAGTVLRIDPATNTMVAAIRVGDAPYGLVTGEGAVWVIAGLNVERIDPSTDRVAARIPVDPMPFELAVGDGSLWGQSWLSTFDPSVGTGSGDRLVIVRVDTATNEVADPVVFDSMFRSIAVAHGGVWFLGQIDMGSGRTISHLDAATLEVDASVDLPAGPTVHNFATYDPSTETIWIANDQDTVTRVDLIDRSPTPEPAAEGASTQGASFAPAEGWHTAQTVLAAGEDRLPVAWAANVPFRDDPAGSTFPKSTVRDLPAGGVVITAVGPRPYTGEERFPSRGFPLRAQDGFCTHRHYEGQPAPHVSVCLLDTMVGDRLLNVTVWLGRPQGSDTPPDELYRAADEGLAQLRLTEEAASAGR